MELLNSKSHQQVAFLYSSTKTYYTRYKYINLTSRLMKIIRKFMRQKMPHIPGYTIRFDKCIELNELPWKGELRVLSFDLISKNTFFEGPND